MSENDQASIAGHEPTLSDLFRQMAQMIRYLEKTQPSLERNARALDATADITTSDEILSRLGQFLAYGGL